MLRTILLSVLVVSALSLTTITNTFPAPTTPISTYARVTYTPDYPFSATPTDIVEISIELLTPVAPILDLTDFTLTLVRSDFSTTSVTIGANAGDLSKVITGTAYGGTLNIVAIRVAGTAASPGVAIYQLQVKVNGIAKLRVVDMVRAEPRSYFYLDKNVTTYPITVSQVTPYDSAAGSATGQSGVGLVGLSGKITNFTAHVSTSAIANPTTA